MGGVFGGLLGGINLLGGVALYLLVGKAAWRKSETATWIRTYVGGILVGEIIGLIVLSIYYMPMYGEAGTHAFMRAGFNHGFYTFWLIPVVCFLLGMFLQALKDRLTKEPPDGE